MELVLVQVTGNQKTSSPPALFRTLPDGHQAPSIFDKMMNEKRTSQGVPCDSRLLQTLVLRFGSLVDGGIPEVGCYLAV